REHPEPANAAGQGGRAVHGNTLRSSAARHRRQQHRQQHRNRDVRFHLVRERLAMRRTIFVITLVLGLAAPAMAQEWIEYESIPDGFKINFPGQPRITDTTWVTGQGYVLPARVYSGEMASGRYSMTVV